MIHISNLDLKNFSFGGLNEPLQRLGVAFTSSSGHIQQGVWESGPGEFDLSFVWDECLFVLEGKAEIENLNSKTKYVLEAGHFFYFEKEVAGSGLFLGNLRRYLLLWI
jgi:uncharacterized cupin superfamily protein